MSKTAKNLKIYYDKGYWNKQMIKNAVIKEKITKEEYAWITGEEYDVE